MSNLKQRFPHSSDFIENELKLHLEGDDAADDSEFIRLLEGQLESANPPAYTGKGRDGRKQFVHDLPILLRSEEPLPNIILRKLLYRWNLLHQLRLALVAELIRPAEQRQFPVDGCRSEFLVLVLNRLVTVGVKRANSYLVRFSRPGAVLRERLRRPAS